MYVFEVRLADADRGVYETLTLRIAQHPSETAEFLVTRLLAYCLEFTEGISFSKGLSDPDEPAISVRDLTGALQRLDRGWHAGRRPGAQGRQGCPESRHLHRTANRNCCWTRLAGERIHRAEALRIRAVDAQLLAAFVARLDRRMNFDLAVSDDVLYISLGDETLTGAVHERRLGSVTIHAGVQTMSRKTKRNQTRHEQSLQQAQQASASRRTGARVFMATAAVVILAVIAATLLYRKRPGAITARRGLSRFCRGAGERTRADAGRRRTHRSTSSSSSIRPAKPARSSTRW